MFTDRDRREASKVAIISQSTARLLWPGEDAVGRRIQLWADPKEIATVVGVVGDMRERGLENDPTSAVYLSYYQYTWYPVPFVVHTAGEPGLLVPAIRSVLAEMDDELPMSDIRGLDEIVTALCKSVFVFTCFFDELDFCLLGDIEFVNLFVDFAYDVLAG